MLLVGDGHARGGVSLGLILLPVLAWTSVAKDERAGHPANAGLIVGLITAVLAIAIVLPPHGSRDVWSYVMYGRILEHYGVSPYTHVPSNFPHDPFLHLAGWRGTPSVYGPVFVAIAAIGSRVAGNSVPAARLFYQGLSAGAVAIALALIWRRTRSPAALAMLGLNPLVVVSVVNGAHNDALVGLGILAAVLFVEDGRLRAAGIALAAVALVKITALLALPALIVFCAFKRGRNAATSLAATTSVVVGLGYAIAGAPAIRALGVTHELMTRATIWRLPRALLDANPGAPHYGLGRVNWLGVFDLAGFGLIGALALTIAWQRRQAVDVADAVTLAL
ncbi:MAG: alpha,6-mannosyltransferase, partial [Actinomycetota bacterium]|nr:alpha,6-mannosyltransferase [Actinomycetota bacterium]